MPSVQNTERLEVIKSDLADITAMWVVDYRGLTVKESQQLRRNIREAGAIMKGSQEYSCSAGFERTRHAKC